MKKIFIPLLLCTSLITSSFAQDNWSLSKCIDHAYEANIQLKQRELGLKSAENSKLQSKLDMLPTLNARVSHSFNFGRTISFASNSYVNENNQTSNLSLGAEAVLFNGFKKLNILKKSKLKVQSRQKDIEISKSDLAINIAGMYLQVLFNSEMLNIAREQLAISKEQQVKTSRLVEAGKLAEIELLKQKSLISQDELALVEAQNNLDISYITLFQVMDVKADNAFKVIILEDIIIDANRSIQSSSDLYAKALEVRPEIAKSEIDIQSYKQDISIARANLIPTLSASAGINSGYADNFINPITKVKDDFMTQVDNNMSKNVRLNLSIPIFNGYQASTSVRNSKLQLENAILEKENTKNALRKEIQQVYASARASMKKYYSAKLASEYSKESFEYSQKKYNAGLIDLVSYKEMKKELFTSSSKFLQAKYDYVFRTKILDYYIGIPMDL
jgi:outer membrane protein